MADLVVRESQGWFEVEPSEIEDTDAIVQGKVDATDIFAFGLYTDAIIDRLDELGVLTEAALGAYEMHDPHDADASGAAAEIFGGVRVLEELDLVTGKWRLRVFVHVLPEALQDAD